MMKDGVSINDELSFTSGKGLTERFGMKGVMTAELFGPSGELKQQESVENTVTTLAHDMMADQLDDSPTIVLPGWMEVGTGTGQDAADSVLAAYISGSRTAITSSTATAEDVVMVCTFGAGVGTGAITEAGVFNVVTQNTTDLLLVASFAEINKGADDSLIITWTLTFA